MRLLCDTFPNARLYYHMVVHNIFGLVNTIPSTCVCLEFRVVTVHTQASTVIGSYTGHSVYDPLCKCEIFFFFSPCIVNSLVPRPS